jgi:hypothetical protein
MLVLIAPLPAVFGMSARSSLARRFATTQVHADRRPGASTPTRAKCACAVRLVARRA